MRSVVSLSQLFAIIGLGCKLAECPTGFSLNGEGLCVEDRDDTANGDTSGDTGAATSYTVCADGLAPYTDIQDAIDAATEGDTITVCAGEYDGEAAITGPAVSLVGADGSAVTTLTAIHNESVLSVTNGQGAETVISGFTFRGGSALDAGGGVYVSASSPRLLDLVLEGNTAVDGGGLALVDSDSVVDAVTITANVASHFGGGVYVGGAGSPDLSHLWLEGNQSGQAATVAVGAEGGVTLSNSVFTGNVNPHNGNVFSLGSYDGLVFNNIFAYNTFTNPGEEYVIFAGAGAYHNNIFYANGGKGMECTGSDVSEYNLGSTNLKAAFGANCGSTNVEVDPRFVDPENGDFTLDALSPAIDAGNPAAAYNDADGTRNDIGAFGGPRGEWQP